MRYQKQLTESSHSTGATEPKNPGGSPGTHGFRRLKNAVKQLGGRAIDQRTSVGKALTEFKRLLISDLGGDAALSIQEMVIIDLAVKSKLFVDSVDVWILQQPSLINKRKRAIFPILAQRGMEADRLARFMGQLGLARRAKPTATLGEYLEGRTNNGTSEEETGNGTEEA